MPKNIIYEPYRFINNVNCKYFPCHDLHGLQRDMFNCLFCYCPLYRIDECGGNPKFIESDGKVIKDCSDCILPHRPEMYEYINAKLSDETFQPPKEEISEFQFLKILTNITQDIRVCSMIIIAMIGTKERPITSRSYRIRHEAFNTRIARIHENIILLNHYDISTIELSEKVISAVDAFSESIHSIETSKSMPAVIPSTWASDMLDDGMIRGFIKSVDEFKSKHNCPEN